ncbi:MAG: hypothetical protein JO157_05940 [Acetobacteraceae bacterium]|nr:hypothetical protein [Acetobacteraceae bacterium]
MSTCCWTALLMTDPRFETYRRIASRFRAVTAILYNVHTLGDGRTHRQRLETWAANARMSMARFALLLDDLDADGILQMEADGACTLAPWLTAPSDLLESPARYPSDSPEARRRRQADRRSRLQPLSPDSNGVVTSDVTSPDAACHEPVTSDSGERAPTHAAAAALGGRENLDSLPPPNAAAGSSQAPERARARPADITSDLRRRGCTEAEIADVLLRLEARRADVARGLASPVADEVAWCAGAIKSIRAHGPPRRAPAPRSQAPDTQERMPMVWSVPGGADDPPSAESPPEAAPMSAREAHVELQRRRLGPRFGAGGTS